MSIESDVVPRLPFVDLEAQQRRLRPAIDAALARVLDRGTYLMGPEVDELEEALAARVGVAHAVACSSGTDALVLALMALGVGPGTAVVVPTFTFVATAEAVVLAGATPLFADAAGPGGNMGPREVEAAIAAGRAAGHDPVGVVAVDLFGHPADHAGIERAAGGRWVVVDGAQSYGAARDGRPVGSTGVATTTSFYPAKPLGGYGDGGAILTADGALADVLRSLRSHGQGTDRYDAVRVGMNGRLDTLQAAVLLQKLTVFDDELARRREVAARYHDGLHGLVTLPAVAPGSEPSWAQYTVEDGDRDALAAALDRAGVPTAVHYPRPLHRQGGYGDHPRAPSLAEAERLCAVVLSLPMHPYLAPADQDRIVAAVREARGVSGATIHPSADVDPGATVGDDTQVWNWSKVREGARIGAGCRIGQSVYIDHHVVVGDGCKVQNGVSVYAGVTLGDHVFVGPSATFTNDRVPRAAGDDEWEVVPTAVGDHASIGANATIVCGVRLGRACMVGAGSVVTHDVPPFALVVGNPARVLDYVDLAGQRRFVGPRRWAGGDVTRTQRTRRDEPVRVAVVGAGQMGSHHARVYAGLKGVELVAVVDHDRDAAAAVAARHGCAALGSVDELDGVDGVTVAVSSSAHAEVACPLLERGVACLVEKPLAASDEDCRAILAAAAHAPLLVGHIERFNPAVRQLREILDGGHQVLAVEARRMSAVSGRITDVDVVSDLMVHDLDIVVDLVGEEVTDVVARGVVRDGGAGDDYVTAMLSFASGSVAALTASRITQNQVRSLHVTTDQRFFTVDYSNQELLIYRQGRIGGIGEGPVDSGRYVLDVGTERVFIRRVEPLVVELTHFVDVIAGRAQPLVSGAAAHAALQLVWRIHDQVAGGSRG